MPLLTWNVCMESPGNPHLSIGGRMGFSAATRWGQE